MLWISCDPALASFIWSPFPARRRLANPNEQVFWHNPRNMGEVTQVYGATGGARQAKKPWIKVTPLFARYHHVLCASKEGRGRRINSYLRHYQYDTGALFCAPRRCMVVHRELSGGMGGAEKQRRQDGRQQDAPRLGFISAGIVQNAGAAGEKEKSIHRLGSAGGG
jgi:hypothetical protein